MSDPRGPRGFVSDTEYLRQAEAEIARLRACVAALGGTYELHYVSADGPGPHTTWSVYVEDYVSPEAETPIDGTQRFVSRHATEAEAEAEAKRRQHTS